MKGGQDIMIKVKFLIDWKAIQSGEVIDMSPGLARYLEEKGIIQKIHVNQPTERHG